MNLYNIYLFIYAIFNNICNFIFNYNIKYNNIKDIKKLTY